MSGVVLEFERAVARAHGAGARAHGAGARAHGAGARAQDGVAAAPAPAPSHPPPPEAQASTTTAEKEEPAMARNTAPAAAAATTSPASPFASFVKRGDDLADRFVGWLGRRALDMAPGVLIAWGVSKATGIDMRIAAPVGAVASQAAAVGIDYLLRDSCAIPEARAARAAFARVAAQLERGVPADRIAADMVAAGWTGDEALLLVRYAQRGAR